jgi:hypothetical protein
VSAAGAALPGSLPVRRKHAALSSACSAPRLSRRCCQHVIPPLQAHRPHRSRESYECQNPAGDSNPRLRWGDGALLARASGARLRSSRLLSPHHLYHSSKSALSPVSSETERVSMTVTLPPPWSRLGPSLGAFNPPRCSRSAPVWAVGASGRPDTCGRLPACWLPIRPRNRVLSPISLWFLWTSASQLRQQRITGCDQESTRLTPT